MSRDLLGDRTFLSLLLDIVVKKVIMIRVHGFRVMFLRYLVRALSVTPNGKGVFLEAAI